MGDAHSVLVFVRVVSNEHLFGEIYRSRVNDWIHGVRSAAPEKDTRRSLEAEPLHAAERLRTIYNLITNHELDGGAGITPKEGEWENVESLFALHDYVYNREWIKRWSTKYVLSPEDLDEIRNRMGESVSVQSETSKPELTVFRLHITSPLHSPTSPSLWLQQQSALLRGYFSDITQHSTLS